MKPLPTNEWDPRNRPVIEAMQGTPLNVHAQLAHHPALLNAWWGLRQYIVSSGDLSQRHSELVILKVAALTNTWYEWASHVDRGLQAGLSLSEIERVAGSLVAADWSEAEHTLLEAATDLTRKGCITPSVLDKLAAHFDVQQTLDIIAIHGMYASLACLLNTWETPLDEAVESRLPGSVTRSTFEGRSASDEQ